MSAGSFVKTKYEADDGSIHQITVQAETAAANFDGTDNDPPAGAITSPFAAEVNRGARAYGLKPRKVRLSFEAVVPTGYRPYTTVEVPVLSKSVFEAIGTEVDAVYLGVDCTVKTKVGESIRPGAAVIGSGETVEG